MAESAYAARHRDVHRRLGVVGLIVACKLWHVLMLQIAVHSVSADTCVCVVLDEAALSCGIPTNTLILVCCSQLSR